MGKLSSIGFALVLCLSASAGAASSGFVFAYRADEVANLARHLDCLADVGVCDRDVYERLWRETWKAHWSADDDTALGQWKKLVERYQGHSFDVNRAGELPASHLFEATELESFGRLRMAALEADSLEDWERRLELVMFSRDAERLVEIARRFAPRFHRYWQEEARPAAERFAADFARAVSRANVGPLIERAAHFYGAELVAGHRLVFHFIYRPRSENHHTYGEALENHAIVEMLAGERPADRVAVVLHEAFHHLYASSAPSRHQHLVQQFSRNPDAMAFGYYNLLNEAIAAALGNGLVQRAVKPEAFDAYLKEPESFMADTFNDRAAKAILPLLERTLAMGGQLDDDAFVREYVTRVRQGLGPFADSPLLLLRVGLIGLPDAALRPYKRLLQRKIAPVLLSTLTPLGDTFIRALRNRPDQSAAILLRPEDVENQATLRALLGPRDHDGFLRAAQSSPVLFVVERSPKAKVFIFVAKDVVDFEKLLDSFVNIPRAEPGPYRISDPIVGQPRPVIHLH